MKIAEIFRSIDGEVNRYGQGVITTFIRLAGCNLNCDYCDTIIDLKKVKDMTIDEILSYVLHWGKKITITGGEPLLQCQDVLNLIDRLLEKDFQITVETNGSFYVPYSYLRKPNLGWVFDYKLTFPEQMKCESMIGAPAHNFIKIVIKSESDYQEAVAIKNYFYEMGCKATFAFSPAMTPNKEFLFSPNALLQKLIEDGLYDVVINVQLHKLIDVV